MRRVLEEFLGYTLPYMPVYDVARAFLIFVGLAILGRVAVLILSGESKTWITSQRAGVAVFVGLALTIVTQQIEALGEPLLWWRLPLLLFIGVNACIVLYAKQTHQGGQVNRNTSLYLVARAAVEDALCDQNRLHGVACVHGDAHTRSAPLDS